MTKDAADKANLLEASKLALLINYTVDENGDDELELSPTDAKCKQMLIAAIVLAQKGE